MHDLEFKIIDPLEYKERVIALIKQLNTKKESQSIEIILTEMVKLPNYTCFALFSKANLIGIATGWTTIRFYCGKQIELDNVIIDSTLQSSGYGKYFMEAIKKWSIENDYKSIGLNTYTQNARSHKFYFNQDFKILGFHFEKSI